MPASVATGLRRTLETAIGNEKTAQSAVSGPAKKRSWNLMETALKYSRTQLKSVAAGAGKYDDPGSESVSHDVAGALKSDAEALDEANHKPSISRVRALIAAALRYKADAVSGLTDLAVSPPPPTAGPLTWCMFVTNNGSSSTENLKLSDPGAGGDKGTVTFNGQGVDQTTPFTFPSSGVVVTPFVVFNFGTATVTFNVMLADGTTQTLTAQATLDAGNDTTSADCATHQ